MTPQAPRKDRSAFSLLEIIIATAILAASAMVLTSLLGLGTTFGNRAEQRTVAMSQAQSLLDEYLAVPRSEANAEEEVTGDLPGAPPHRFRLSVAPFAALSSEQSGMDANSLSATNSIAGLGITPQLGKLTRVTVEIFEAQQASDAGDPLCRISRVIRSHRLQALVDPNAPAQRNPRREQSNVFEKSNIVARSVASGQAVP